MSSVAGIVEEMRAEYLEDCASKLVTLDGLLSGGQAGEDRSLEQVERIAHSIKGSAFTFGLAAMSQLCAAWEGEMKRARNAGEAGRRLDEWRTYRSMFGVMVRGDAPAASAGTRPSVLICSPFEATRESLAAALQGRVAETAVARTDTEALRRIASLPVGSLVSAVESDGDLDLTERARLLSAASAGSGAAWFCAGLEGEGGAAFAACGAQPLESIAG